MSMDSVGDVGDADLPRAVAIGGDGSRPRRRTAGHRRPPWSCHGNRDRRAPEAAAVTADPQQPASMVTATLVHSPHPPDVLQPFIWMLLVPAPVHGTVAITRV